MYQRLFCTIFRSLSDKKNGLRKKLTLRQNTPFSKFYSYIGKLLKFFFPIRYISFSPFCTIWSNFIKIKKKFFSAPSKARFLQRRRLKAYVALKLCRVSKTDFQKKSFVLHMELIKMCLLKSYLLFISSFY